MTAPSFLALLSVLWLASALVLVGSLQPLVLGLNAVGFVLFVFDKLQARAGRARIPELVLHAVMLVAPAGGCLGRRLASHKTRHASFDASAVLGLACWAALILVR